DASAILIDRFSRCLRVTCRYSNPSRACTGFLQWFDTVVNRLGNPYDDLPCCPPNLTKTKPEVIFGPTGLICEPPRCESPGKEWGDADPPICCHPGAKACMRSDPIPNTPVLIPGCRPGQQCCYDSDCDLMQGGPGAGTPDLCSPGDD